MFSPAALVVDDRDRGIFRVNRAAMTEEEVLEAERRSIFDRYWLYLGHESEVETPGDYLRRSRMGRPLIFLRNMEGKVDVFYDTCTHRGATLCREECGNTKRFTCFYHAWTFDTFGQLVTLPDELSYGAGFDRADRALVHPPRLESYRGFYFVSFNPEVEPLEQYLAGARDYLDLIVDQTVEGMRVLPGSNLYATKANWKLLVENSIDGYHGLPVHQTYFAYLASTRGETSATRVTTGYATQLGNGHAVIETQANYGRPIAKWDNLFGEDAKPEIAAIRAEIVARCGEERGRRMCTNIRNMAIFPNLIVNDISALTIRYVEPVAPGVMEIQAWALAPKEETARRISRRVDSYLTFIGPGGFATPDDVEALESCQKGFAARPGVDWSDISRGMTRTRPTMMDELQMRTWWRAWRAAMAGEPLPGALELPESTRGAAAAGVPQGATA